MLACCGLLMADLQGAQANLGDFQFCRSEKSFGISYTMQSYLTPCTKKANLHSTCWGHLHFMTLHMLRGTIPASQRTIR